MATLNLRLFGHPFVELDGQPVEFETRKALAMLAYLALSPQPVSREFLATLLWPEFNQTQALSNLRRNLSSLEKSLPKILNADRQVLFFNETATLSIDVQDFRQNIWAIAAHKHVRFEVCEDCLDTLERTIQAYRGEFMEGFNLRDCPEFDDWQYQQRQTLQQEYHQVLVTNINQCIAMRQWYKGILTAQRLVELDNLDEASQRRLICLYAMDNQRTAALQQYQECLQTLKKELNQIPAVETTQLYVRIREGNPIQYEEIQGLLCSAGENSLEEPKQLRPLARNEYLENILRTKLFIPVVRKGAINRPHLITRLNRGIHGALTLISAPAGFGKTTLLADWAAQFSSTVGWVSLEVDDNDPVRFMTYLIMGLKSIKPDIGELSLGMLAAQQISTLQTAIVPLLNDISQTSAQFFIVLDDYQVITSEQVQKIMSFIIEHQCANLHLVIATRSDPFLPLARLRARNQLTDIRAEDLRFSMREAEQFLNSEMGLNLSAQDIAVLGERTEGWIAGLQMAALSMSTREDKATFIKKFGGSHHYIMDYLVDEVLSQQPEIIHTFLLKTSILERLSGSLCDALSGSSSGHEMLDKLEKMNLFLVALDDEHQWYRYHHLFAQLLRSRAERKFGEASINDLNRQAASWFEKNEMVEEAVLHAMAAQDYQHVSCLIEQNQQKIMAHGEFDLALKWIEALPGEVINSRLRLLAFQARIFGILNRTQEMMLTLDKLEQQVKQNPNDNDLTGINADVCYLRAMAAYKESDFVQAFHLALLAQKQAKGEDLEFQNNLLMLIGLIQLDLGKISEASRAFSEVTKTVSNKYSLNDIRLIFSAMVSLADIQVIRGELRNAEQIYNNARNIALQWGDANFHVIGRVFISLGDIKYQQNELELSRAYIQKGIDHYQKWGHASDMAISLASLARVLQASGIFSEANEAIKRALEETKRSTAGVKAINFVRQQQYRIMMMNEDINWVDRWLQENNTQEYEEITYSNEQDFILRVRLLFFQNKLEAATLLLNQLAEAAQTSDRNGSLIQIFILQALIARSQGQNKISFSWLIQALNIAEPQGYVRVFIDEGESMRALLQEYRSEIDTGNLRAENQARLSLYVNKILAAFSIDQGQTNKVSRSLPFPEPLTSREMEILTLICMGLSNREIARKLFVTDSTVKTHLHHIFEKINVESRAQLIVRAHELKLI